MTTRTIRTDGDIDGLARLLRSRKLPLTVHITQGEPRSTAQNRLQRQWCNDVSQQLGDRSPEDVRAYSKLHFGVPILRADDDAYCEAYDRLIRPLPYETKLAYMAVPFDFAVTRAMTTKQLTRYLDAMAAHWAAQGVRLTDPGAMMYG
jgi:hypothetical protein